MKTYNLAKEIGIINLPSDACSIRYNGNILFYEIFNGSGYDEFYKIIGTGYSILSIAKEMTEELAKMIMPYKNRVASYEVAGCDFPDYEEVPALERFYTFMQSLQMPCFNPYQSDWDELCTWGHGDFSKDGKTSFELWQEAEAKLVNSLILVKDGKTNHIL